MERTAFQVLLDLIAAEQLSEDTGGNAASTEVTGAIERWYHDYQAQRKHCSAGVSKIFPSPEELSPGREGRQWEQPS